jgi:TFIIH basal transcription factor complex TTD-A subunit
MNEEEAFIIEDLDETHLFVQVTSIDSLKERFELRMEENIFKLSDGSEVKSTW